MPSQPAYTWMFEPGARARHRRGGEVSIWCRTIADLVVTSGRIVACDPFQCAKSAPFRREVMPGRYPVVIALAEFARGGDRVAGAMLRLRDETPKRWESAQLADETARRSHGYCVDSGMGAFVDDEAIDLLCDLGDERDQDGSEYLWSLVELAAGKYGVGGNEWFDIAIDPSSGLNVAMFTSGYGDGSYGSHWGLDAGGVPVCLVTDFGVLDDAERVE